MSKQSNKFVNKWNRRKHRNLYLAVLAKLASECPNLQRSYNFKKATMKLLSCGSFIGGFATKNQNYHVADCMTRCDYRYCNICQFIKSRMLTNRLAMIYKYELHKKYTSGHGRYKMLFITATTPDVPGTINGIEKGRAELRNDVRSFLSLPEIRGWNSSRQHYNGLCLGATAKYEHTDKVRQGKAWVNLHCHITMLVHASYKQGSKYYKTKRQWHNLWKAVTGHDYNIFEKTCYYKDKLGKKRTLNANSSDKAIDKLAKEVGKYEGKGQDLFKTGKKNLNEQVHTLMSKKKKIGDSKRVHALDVLNKKLKPSDLPVQFFAALVIGFRGAREVQYYGSFRTARHLLSKGALSKYNVNDPHVYALHSDLHYIFAQGRYIKVINYITKSEILDALYRFWRKGVNRIMSDKNGKIYKAVDYTDLFKKRLNNKHQNHKKVLHKHAKAVSDFITSKTVVKHDKRVLKKFDFSAKCVHYKMIHLNSIMAHGLADGFRHTNYSVTYNSMIKCLIWHAQLSKRLHIQPKIDVNISDYEEFKPSVVLAEAFGDAPIASSSTTSSKSNSNKLFEKFFGAETF